MKKLITGFMMGICVIVATSCTGKNDENEINHFANSMFVGDSITEGFVFNEILPEESVIAGAGTTAGFLHDDIDLLIEKNPDNVFIMLGSVDLLMPVDNPKELFEEELTKLITKIIDNSPNSEIYLQSITPVTQEAIEDEARYKKIDEYNQLLEEISDSLSITYVDIAALAEENLDLFAEDGIHFKKEFYQLWLDELSKLF